MGVIATDKNKIILIYSSENSIGKQTYAYTESSKKKLLAIDISKTELTGTQWAEIADNLNVEIADLVNQEHPDYKDNFDKNAELSEDDWIKMLRNNPEILKYPVLILEENYIFIKSAADFKKYFSPDSGAISRNPAEEN